VKKTEEFMSVTTLCFELVMEIETTDFPLVYRNHDSWLSEGATRFLSPSRV